MSDVVVTAERRAVSLQDVPVAVSAFTGEQRELQGIQTIQDMTNFTPGLTYSTQLDRTNMRGLGRLTNVLAADAAVAVYSDDFFTTSTTEAGRDTLFVNRVEVLRGPQGTLYGRNAIGGAINIISNRPTPNWYGEVRATFGNYNYQNYEGVISGPVTSFMRFRLSAYDTQQTQGYFRNLAGGPTEGAVKHEWYVEAQIELDLGEHAEFWVKAFTQRWDTNRGGPGSLLGTPTIGRYDTALNSPALGLLYNPGFGYNPLAINPVGRAGLTDNPALTNIRTFAHNTPLDIDLRDTWAINAHLTYHFPGADLKYITGYNTYDYNLNSDWDNTNVTSYRVPLDPAGQCATVFAGFGCGPLTVYPSEIFNYREQNNWYSHEVTLSSTYEGPLQYIIGAYYFDEHYRQPTTISAEARQTQVFAPILGPANPSGALYSAEYAMETRSQAIFGQLDWQITPQFKVTGGLRYTRDHKSGDEFYRLILFSDGGGAGTAGDLGSFLPAIDLTQFVVGTGPAPGVRVPASALPDGRWTRTLAADFSAFTGTAGVQWTPNEDNLLYLRFSRGYKAGGLNAGTLSESPLTQPEHVNAYEAGYKWTYGRTFELQSAIYYYDYQNAQIPIGVNIGGTIQTQFFNMPRSRSQGIELAAVWSPIERLNVSATYSFNDTSVSTECRLVAGVATGACVIDANDPLGTATGAQPIGPQILTATGAQQPQSVRGAALPQAPRNKFAINVNYTWNFGPGDLILSGSYIWKDESYADIFQRSYNRAPAWDQVDLRATWRSSNRRYQIIAYVRNVFDSLGYEAAATGIPLSYATVSSYALTPPRTFGIEVHYRFN